MSTYPSVRAAHAKAALSAGASPSSMSVSADVTLELLSHFFDDTDVVTFYWALQRHHGIVMRAHLRASKRTHVARQV